MSTVLPGQGDEEGTDLDGIVNLAIFDFHAAHRNEAGTTPAAWIASHPEIAPQLESYFRDLSEFLTDGPRLPIAGDEPTRTYHAVDADGLTSLSRSRTGDRIGGYELIELLGGGGQGEVWKARHLKSNDVVAVKVLHPWAEQDESSIRRLTEEAKTIAGLRHPNIVGIKYFDRDRGRWFFSMDLIEGGTLASRFRDQRPEPAAAARLMEKVARAIHHAHTRNPGVLHLDLKPGNILLGTDGEPRVTDFGLAVRLETFSKASRESLPVVAREEASPYVDASTTLGRIGAVGTYPYMSPEMADGRWDEISTASDIYGLGAVLYFLLTGRPPYQGVSHVETLRQIKDGKLTPPRRLNGKVDTELQSICLTCLNQDPARRYGSADAMANDLVRRLRNEPTLAGRPSVGKYLLFWLRRHPILFASLLLAFAVLALMAGSFNQVRVSNAREASRLAQDIEDKLAMIGRAIGRSARDEELLRVFRDRADDPVALRHGLDAFLAETTKDFNYWFDLSESKPLYNLFLLDPHGRLLADTIANGEQFIGRDFSRREYFKRLFEAPHESDPRAVCISPAYHSIKDDHYKIAVSTRVWEGTRCIGVIVANVTIGWRLVDLNMNHELLGAALVSPMDWTYSNHEGNPKPRYLTVLSRNYPDPDVNFEPIWSTPDQLPDMPAFVKDPTLIESVDLLGDDVTNYHRVGETPLVAILRHPHPWPLNRAYGRWLFAAFLGILCLLLLALFRKHLPRFLHGPRWPGFPSASLSGQSIAADTERISDPVNVVEPGRDQRDL